MSPEPGTSDRPPRDRTRSPKIKDEKPSEPKKTEQRKGPDPPFVLPRVPSTEEDEEEEEIVSPHGPSAARRTRNPKKKQEVINEQEAKALKEAQQEVEELQEMIGSADFM